LKITHVDIITHDIVYSKFSNSQLDTMVIKIIKYVYSLDTFTWEIGVYSCPKL